MLYTNKVHHIFILLEDLYIDPDNHISDVLTGNPARPGGPGKPVKPGSP